MSDAGTGGSTSLVCSDDSDCTGEKSRCDASTGMCVTCLVDADCAGRVQATCNGGTCSGRSCSALAATCGPSSDESCCASLPVPGGTFYLGVGAVATVSDFQLDKFEVTVGRFRKFVAAWYDGWRPSPGDGKHTHLNGGNGLADSSGTTVYEEGWDPTWTPSLTDLTCDIGQAQQTWTTTAAGNEDRPMNCLLWHEAYAFCIWDGGFLPTEAEWAYSASGGSEQRVYPWSSPPSSTAVDCSYANYGGSNFPTTACSDPGSGSTNDVGSESPKGNGLYGQADLAGNVSEWNLDGQGSLSATCNDCAYLPAGYTSHSLRGGSFASGASSLTSSYRGFPLSAPLRGSPIGVRCARIIEHPGETDAGANTDAAVETDGTVPRDAAE